LHEQQQRHHPVDRRKRPGQILGKPAQEIATHATQADQHVGNTEGLGQTADRDDLPDITGDQPEDGIERQRNFFAIRAGNYKASGNYYYCGKNASVSLGQVDEHLCEFIYSFDNAELYRLQVYPLLPGELKGEVLRTGLRHDGL
jgi:hypothetical protein